MIYKTGVWLSDGLERDMLVPSCKFDCREKAWLCMRMLVYVVLEC